MKTQGFIQPRTVITASAMVMALWGVSCHDGSSQKKPAAAAVAASIQASAVSGIVSTQFDLHAELLDPDATVSGPVEFAWDFGDGSQASGPDVSVTYAAPGTYAVTLDVFGTAGAQMAQSSVLLTVFDPGSPQGLFGEALAPVPGDVDGDGTIELADALRIRQHVSGVVPIVDPVEAERADINYDGAVNAFDAELLSLALISATGAPRVLEPAVAHPGQVVTIYSPALLDPEADVQVQMGLAEAVKPPRLVLGQISAVVPLDVFTPGGYTEVGGATEVKLLVDGIEADAFALEVLDSPPPTDLSSASATALFEMMANLRTSLAADVQSYLADPLATETGISADEAEVLMALLDAGFEELAALEQGTAQMLAELPAENQELVARLAATYGLEETRAEIEALLASDFTVGAGTFDILCKIEQAKAILDEATDKAQLFCAVWLGLAGAWIAFSGPPELLDVAVLLKAAFACAKYTALLELPNLAFSFVPKLGQKLKLEASPPSGLALGETTEITPLVELLGLDELCQVASGKLAGSVEDYLAKKITYAVLHKGPVFLIYTTVKQISGETTKAVVDLVKSAVGSVLGLTPLPDYLETLAGSACGYFDSVDASLPLDASLVSASVTPAVGTLVQGTASTPILYTCPVDPEMVPQGGVTVKATLLTCAGSSEGILKIECGEVKNVTINMGDNGSLLDDIFEVVVDGQSVLTSSVPVTFVSTTIQLVEGQHQLQMKGLAAPDGIGTYFIEVIGGTLSGGPPLSGSDLTAGTVFTWQLDVP